MDKEVKLAIAGGVFGLFVGIIGHVLLWGAEMLNLDGVLGGLAMIVVTSISGSLLALGGLLSWIDG